MGVYFKIRRKGRPPWIFSLSFEVTLTNPAKSGGVTYRLSAGRMVGIIKVNNSLQGAYVNGLSPRNSRKALRMRHRLGRTPTWSA